MEILKAALLAAWVLMLVGSTTAAIIWVYDRKGEFLAILTGATLLLGWVAATVALFRPS